MSYPYQPIPEHMINIEDSEISHVLPEDDSRKWSHVKDLDQFFRDSYKYYDRGGLKCIKWYNIGVLIFYAFIVSFTTFSFAGVNYEVLFQEGGNPDNKDGKRHIRDIVLPWSEAQKNFIFPLYCLLFIAVLYLCWQIYSTVDQLYRYKKIKDFYEEALQIKEEALANVSWKEVQIKLINAQKEHRMSIANDEISELDICHRVLRYENYFIAMVNKGVIPVKIDLPLIGSTCILSRYLKFMLDHLLFKSHWSPFRGSCELNPDYLRTDRKSEVVRQMRDNITKAALVSFFLIPFVFIWQILHAFCSYSDIIRRERGGVLAKRCWSLYGQTYVRHLNELKHDLRDRLNRSYEPTVNYLDSYSNKKVNIVAKFVSSIFGTITCAITILSVFDYDVLGVEHMFTILVVCGTIALLTANLLPKENQYMQPADLLKEVVKIIHYVPDQWATRANSAEIRKEFSMFLQLKASRIVEDIVAPVVIPIVLYFVIAPKSEAIVDFFKNFTVRLGNVGDICAFAQMNVRKHGNYAWQPNTSSSIAGSVCSTTGGKTELSLIRFSKKNPNWNPPQESVDFLEQFNNMLDQEAPLSPLFECHNQSQNGISAEPIVWAPRPEFGSIYGQSMYGSQAASSQFGMNDTQNLSYIGSNNETSEICFPNPRDMYKQHDETGRTIDRSIMLMHRIHDTNTALSS